MNKKLTIATLSSLLATSVLAGGIDRSGQGISVLFEKGNVMQLNLSMAKPTVEGTIAHPRLGNLETGDAAGDYTSKAFSIKSDVNPNFSIALIYDEPFGALADYPVDKATLGLNAELTSANISAIGKFNFGETISAYAGVAMQTLEATMANPPSRYAVVADKSTAYGWLAGAAYEIPEIAMRVDLTYRSQIDHKDIAISETAGTAVIPSTTDVSTPQSLNLNLQTGINEKTLIFAGARWVDWSEFNISPMVYTARNGAPLVSYTEDTITYTLGGARKITDQFSVLGSIAYEAATDETATMLSPTNGRTTYSIAGQYTIGGSKIRAGVSYVNLGDAQAPYGPLTATFQDNTGIGFGLQLTQSF